MYSKFLILSFVLVIHPCINGNGGCSHLCFAVSSNKKECSCPDGFYGLDADGKTCLKNKPSCPGYQCHSSYLCISESKKCNGVIDCPEHDDERNCLQKVTTLQSGYDNTKPVYPSDNEKDDLSNNDKNTNNRDNYLNIAIGVSVCLLLVVLIVVGYIVYRRKRLTARMR